MICEFEKCVRDKKLCNWDLRFFLMVDSYLVYIIRDNDVKSWKCIRDK